MADDVASSDELGESAGDDIVRHDFATGFRGFDPAEVTAHLERVAARVRELETALESARATAAVARTGAPDDVPLDEIALMEDRGAEAGNIHRRAHVAAAEAETRAAARAATLRNATP